MQILHLQATTSAMATRRLIELKDAPVKIKRANILASVSNLTQPTTIHHSSVLFE